MNDHEDAHARSAISQFLRGLYSSTWCRNRTAAGSNSQLWPKSLWVTGVISLCLVRATSRFTPVVRYVVALCAIYTNSWDSSPVSGRGFGAFFNQAISGCQVWDKAASDCKRQNDHL